MTNAEELRGGNDQALINSIKTSIDTLNQFLNECNQRKIRVEIAITKENQTGGDSKLVLANVIKSLL